MPGILIQIKNTDDPDIVLWAARGFGRYFIVSKPCAYTHLSSGVDQML